jgi:hypothetical protein
MTTKAITRTDAVKAINLLLSNHTNGEAFIGEILQDVVYAVNKDLQLRDYLMGLPAEHPELSVKEIADFIEALLPQIEEADKAPFLTVRAGFLYEIGDTPSATTHLANALLINPNYPLAKLLVRVIEAKWDNQQFAEMRSVCHYKVLEEITNNDGEIN